MRVILLTPEYPPFIWGGVGTHVQQLAVALAQRGHEVHTFSFAPYQLPTASERGVTNHYLAPNKSSSEYTVPSLDDVEELNAQCLQLIRQLFASTHHLPHIIHLHGWYGILAARDLKSEFGWPVVMTAHGIHRGQHRERRNELMATEVDPLEEREHLAIKTVDRIIAVSHLLRQKLLEEYELPDDFVNTIWNGLDPASLEDSTGEEIDRSILELCFERLKTRRLLLFVGRVVRAKGVLPLLRVFQEVLRRAGDVQLILAGEMLDPSYGELVTEFVNADPLLSEHVLFTGKLSQSTLAILYQHAYLVVIPSSYEALPYVALEAMAYSKPVIASDAGGLVEVVKQDETGLLVPLTKNEDDGSPEVDSAALSSALMRVLDDASLASRFGANGRERFLARFTVEQMTVSTERLYTDVLAQCLKLPARHEALPIA